MKIHDFNPVIGKTYTIDDGYSNSGEVILISYGELFCRVKDPDTKNEWDTMLYRLSEIELTTPNQ